MSTLGVKTFLWFADDVHEAVEFYRSVFPELRVGREEQAAENLPGPGGTMTLDFELFGQQFTAFHGGPGHPFAEACSIWVSVQTQADIDHYWAAFLAGGSVEVACGWLRDRWGLSWQIVPDEAMRETLGGPDPAGSRRAVDAMLQMKKLDIEALRSAYRGT